MSEDQINRIRALLAGRMLFPEARALANLMLQIHERRNGQCASTGTPK